MSTYNDIIYGIGDFFTWIFQAFPVLGNVPNFLFAVSMAVGVIYWLNLQFNFSKKARENGTIE